MTKQQNYVTKRVGKRRSEMCAVEGEGCLREEKLNCKKTVVGAEKGGPGESVFTWNLPPKRETVTNCQGGEVHGCRRAADAVKREKKQRSGGTGEVWRG